MTRGNLSMLHAGGYRVGPCHIRTWRFLSGRTAESFAPVRGGSSFSPLSTAFTEFEPCFWRTICRSTWQGLFRSLSMDVGPFICSTCDMPRTKASTRLSVRIQEASDGKRTSANRWPIRLKRPAEVETLPNVETSDVGRSNRGRSPPDSRADHGGVQPRHRHILQAHHGSPSGHGCQTRAASSATDSDWCSRRAGRGRV